MLEPHADTPRKTLPRELTSYDLLKSLAIVLMIIDHAGYFFFPEDVWFRVFGRLCVPIWFFLIGYAETRRVQPMIWVGGALIWMSALVAGEYLLPVNILFSLAFARLMINGVMRRALKNYESLSGMVFLLFLLALPSGLMLEYGSLGLIFTMFGFLRRHRADLTLGPAVHCGFAVAAMGIFILVESVLLPSLDARQLAVFFAGMVFVMTALYAFKPRTYPRAPRVLGFLKLTGRRTLEIYVLHLLLFRGIAMAVDPERFGFMEFEIAPRGMLAIFVPGLG